MHKVSLLRLERCLTMAKDYCSLFPEYWIQWWLWKGFVPLTKKVYIGDCCKKHDEECRTKTFIDCMRKKKVVGSYIIVGVSAIACLIRYNKS